MENKNKIIMVIMLVFGFLSGVIFVLIVEDFETYNYEDMIESNRQGYISGVWKGCIEYKKLVNGNETISCYENTEKSYYQIYGHNFP